MDVIADMNRSISTKSSLYLRGIIILCRSIEAQLHLLVKALIY